MLTVTQSVICRLKEEEKRFCHLPHVDRALHKQLKKSCHFHKDTAISDFVSLKGIKCVSETIHTHAYVVHSVELHCAMQEAHIQTKVQHTLSHLLFNISAPLLLPA